MGPAEWDKAWGSMVNKGGLVAFDLGGSGDTTKTNVRWSYRKGTPSIPSALVYDDLVYVVRDGGILSAIEADSGKLVKQARLQPAGRVYDAYHRLPPTDCSISLPMPTGGSASSKRVAIGSS